MISTDQINTLVSGGIVTDTSGEKVGQVGRSTSTTRTVGPSG